MWTCPRIDRRAAAALLLLVCAPAAWSFGWDQARALARTRAQASYAPPPPLEGWLAELDPRAWGRIRFDPRRAP
jgi:glucan biosynthesis protein